MSSQGAWELVDRMASRYRRAPREHTTERGLALRPAIEALAAWGADAESD